MFTGIIEETGTVVEFSEQAAAYRLKLAVNKVLEDTIGDPMRTWQEALAAYIS